LWSLAAYRSFTSPRRPTLSNVWRAALTTIQDGEAFFLSATTKTLVDSGVSLPRLLVRDYTIALK